ncbi:uncharacterized protein SCHCODRAFT_02719608 [Schizophyllum commune H4-8]|nr:uncharacterized protein SCHCODRAFT_02719608 [Schizophyllum commune H4-8]KAI5884804.1 hypothetical protein SCHCODRAFT_02719608 [Schizophyllum commune H4-8]
MARNPIRWASRIAINRGIMLGEEGPIANAQQCTRFSAPPAAASARFRGAYMRSRLGERQLADGRYLDFKVDSASTPFIDPLPRQVRALLVVSASPADMNYAGFAASASSDCNFDIPIRARIYCFGPSSLFETESSPSTSSVIETPIASEPIPTALACRHGVLARRVILHRASRHSSSLTDRVRLGSPCVLRELAEAAEMQQNLLRDLGLCPQAVFSVHWIEDLHCPVVRVTFYGPISSPCIARAVVVDGTHGRYLLVDHERLIDQFKSNGCQCSFLATIISAARELRLRVRADSLRLLKIMASKRGVEFYDKQLGMLHDILDTAHEIGTLPGETPLADGDIRVTALRRALTKGAKFVFGILVSEPPASPLTADDKRVEIVLTSIAAFASICDAEKRLRSRNLLPLLRTLWPHIVQWGALVHPARGYLVCTPALRESGRDTTSLACAYWAIVDSDAAHCKPFIEAYPDLIAQACELWIHFPRYVPSAAGSTSSSAYSAIATIVKLHDRLATSAAESIDNDCSLLLQDLLRVAGTSRGLYRAWIRQTEFLTRSLLTQPFLEHIWPNHFVVLDIIAGQPAFQIRTVLLGLIATVTSTAIRCAASNQTRRGAQHAARSLASLFLMADDNRPLVRAIDAGLLDLLSTLCRPSDSTYVVDLMRYVAPAVMQARVYRAIIRRNPAVKYYPSGRKLGSGSWDDVAMAVNLAHDLYYSSHHQKHWRQYLPCHNEQGPHNRALCVCPCAEAFYCSGSCQRIHWAVHRRLSLGDTLFILGTLRFHLKAHIKVLNLQVSAYHQALVTSGQSKQIVVDLNVLNEIPLTKHDVYFREADDPGLSDVIAFEASFRVGSTIIKRPLPFFCHIKDLF